VSHDFVAYKKHPRNKYVCSADIVMKRVLYYHNIMGGTNIFHATHGNAIASKKHPRGFLEQTFSGVGCTVPRASNGPA